MNGEICSRELFVYLDFWSKWAWEACEETSLRKRKRERKQNIRGKINGANMNSLLKLLWFLLRLFLVGDNKVDGILWLLKQSSQFSLDLLSPEDSTNTNPYRCPLALLTYTNTWYMLCMNWISKQLSRIFTKCTTYLSTDYMVSLVSSIFYSQSAYICFSENFNLFSLIFLSFCTSAIEHFYYWLVQLSSVQ